MQQALLGWSKDSVHDFAKAVAAYSLLEHSSAKECIFLALPDCSGLNHNSFLMLISACS